MIDLIWTAAAFLVLETLPQATAFGIIRHTDHLRRFPKLGFQISSPRNLSNYRQLIYRKKYRIIYRLDEVENCVRIVNLHNCSQKFPTASELARALRDEEELPLE
jgi:hypothetical protein